MIRDKDKQAGMLLKAWKEFMDIENMLYTKYKQLFRGEDLKAMYDSSLHASYEPRHEPPDEALS
jgi:hypothetical protein